MLRGVVIGLGAMGRNHARVLREIDNGVELVAVSDLDLQRAAKVGDCYGVPYFTNYVEMLEVFHPDFAVLAVPTSLHCKIGLDLIEREIPVLIEKPIASTIEEGKRLCEAAERKGVTLGVGYIERFNPVVNALRQKLDEGMLGHIYKIQAQRLSPYPSRIQDVGVVIDLATHDIDLFRYLMADNQIERLYSATRSTINSDREDMFVGVAHFHSGAVGLLDVNWMTPAKIRALTITGAFGMFSCNLLSQELFFYENDDKPSGWDALSTLRGVTQGNVLGINIQRFEPLTAEVRDFADAILKQAKPRVTGRDALETLKLALEFVQSGQEGQIVVRSSEAEPAGVAP